ncbi:acetyltransferase [Klebsiella pneumoniae]|uniref:Acetyltransferase n=1 Tax=Klebsiella pneumoniae TaxID=573 RepID=A0A447RRU3_KLEPN|nr:acetyltransferase [Klebsiella pneumoniae]
MASCASYYSFMSGRESAARARGGDCFSMPCTSCQKWGASGLYISSIPNKNTVDFYLAQGCRLADKPDPALFALEPEDIHLVCDRL